MPPDTRSAHPSTGFIVTHSRGDYFVRVSNRLDTPAELWLQAFLAWQINGGGLEPGSVEPDANGNWSFKIGDVALDWPTETAHIIDCAITRLREYFATEYQECRTDAEQVQFEVRYDPKTGNYLVGDTRPTDQQNLATVDWVLAQLIAGKDLIEDTAGTSPPPGWLAFRPGIFGSHNLGTPEQLVPGLLGLFQETAGQVS